MNTSPGGSFAIAIMTLATTLALGCDAEVLPEEAACDTCRESGVPDLSEAQQHLDVRAASCSLDGMALTCVDAHHPVLGERRANTDFGLTPMALEVRLGSTEVLERVYFDDYDYGTNRTGGPSDATLDLSGSGFRPGDLVDVTVLYRAGDKVWPGTAELDTESSASLELYLEARVWSFGFISEDPSIHGSDLRVTFRKDLEGRVQIGNVALEEFMVPSHVDTVEVAFLGGGEPATVSSPGFYVVDAGLGMRLATEDDLQFSAAALQ